MKCPKCNGDQWKLASLVYAEGTTKREGFFTGGGLESDAGQANPIFGFGTTNQTERTRLAELAAPPEKGPMPKAKVIKVESNKKLYIGLVAIFITVAFIFYVESKKIEGPLSIIVTLAGFIFSIFNLLKSIILQHAGPEAEQNRRRKINAKNEYDRHNADVMARYKRTRICLRCGHFYVADQS